MITAPFNFVPVSEEVFFPLWSDNVSHDIPFEDTQSGVLDITITAKSPIFVRDSEDKEEFCSHNGEYYIPSTSVKGTIKNILEIMSFSKMSQVDDDTYAVRDLSSARNFYMTQMGKNIFCGWLVQKEEEYLIEDCGEVGRIRHEEIDRAFKIDFASNFKKVGFEKTSQYKYDILGTTHQTITVGDSYKSTTNAKYDKRLFHRYEKEGEKATLVVTGQPTPRGDTGKMGDGKGFEFLFFETKKEIKLPQKTMDNFLFAYFDKRETEPKESPDWTFWKEKLSNGEKVPVFFQKDGNQIAHFGLSYLYKLPYKYSIKDGLPPLHSKEKLDLAQTIFGYVNDTQALKGRVQFSHFKAISAIKKMKTVTEVLGSPRASYYPIYVTQNGDEYKTFMNDDFSIAGWKRYPIHQTNVTKKTDETENENIGTTFTPLKNGIIFKGKLRYHNLKKIELGAIISALTFHNTADTFHNIGMAKALGYGKVKIAIKGLDTIENYLKAFEVEMASNISNWAKSEQLLELISMATPQSNSGNSTLTYMDLEDFATNKSKTKDFLRNYTALKGIKKCTIKSLVSTEDIEEANQLKIEQIEIQKQQKIFDNALSLVLKSDNITLYENFIQKYSDYKDIDKIIATKEKLQKSQESNKFEKVDTQVKSAWNELQKKKSNPKQYAKLRDKFIKKWEDKKNNKGSSVVLDFVKKARE